MIFTKGRTRRIVTATTGNEQRFFSRAAKLAREVSAPEQPSRLLGSGENAVVDGAYVDSD
jgi:hypothetical protein